MLEPAHGYVAIYEEFKGNASQNCSQWKNSKKYIIIIKKKKKGAQREKKKKKKE